MKRGSKQSVGIILMLICSVCLCAGQFIWKRSSGLPSLLLGFAVYGVGAVIMIVAYHFGSLSVLQPINSVSYVISAVLGALYFGETIAWMKIMGIVVILAGVLILTGEERSKT